jgi:hypothetical protein
MPTIPFKMRDVEQVKKSLRSAWGTELLLYFGHKFLRTDEVIRLSNTWNVVQAYYAVYHSTQAVAVARGFARSETHPKTQRVFLDCWGKLPDCFMPWCLSYHSSGHKSTTIKIDSNVHTWVIVDRTNCSSLACKALRTTRADFLEDNCKKMRESKQKALRKAWTDKEKERIASGKKPRSEPKFPLPTLTPQEKNKIEEQTRAYTLLDYLYRLRIRTNYKDSGIFTDGPEHELESKSVMVSLIRIVSTSLFASELILLTCPDGRKHLQDWAEHWLQANVPKDIHQRVKQRIAFW